MIATTTTVIQAEQRERLPALLKEIWQYRELFWTFVERDLKLRYKQTALGAIWVVMQPLVTTGAFAFIFGSIAQMPTDGLPVVLFYFAANVPWQGFSRALTGAAMSIESNANLVTKVYFPRLVVPGAFVTGSFVDFSIGWALLNIVAAVMHRWHWQLVALTPLLIAIQAVMSLGFGLALAALNAQYRDVKHAIGFFVQMLMLATPVIYPLSRLPVWLQPWLFLNPMAIVVDTYRRTLQGGPFDWPMLGLSALTAAVYFAGGFWLFRNRETRLADIL